MRSSKGKSAVSADTALSGTALSYALTVVVLSTPLSIRTRSGACPPTSLVRMRIKCCVFIRTVKNRAEVLVEMGSPADWGQPDEEADEEPGAPGDSAPLEATAPLTVSSADWRSGAMGARELMKEPYPNARGSRFGLRRRPTVCRARIVGQRVFSCSCR